MEVFSESSSDLNLAVVIGGTATKFSLDFISETNSPCIP